MEHARPPTELILEGGPSNRADTWRKWLRQFKIFLKASGVAKEEKDVQASLLLNIIGADGYDVYSTFRFATESDREDIDKLIEQFNSHFGTKTNTILIRFKFFTRNQEVNESIDEYVTALKILSSQCEFDKLEESLVRDRIVCGVVDASVRDRLLRTEDLTLERAVKICQANEISCDERQQIESVKREPSQSVSVNSVRNYQYGNSGYSVNNNNSRSSYSAAGRMSTAAGMRGRARGGGGFARPGGGASAGPQPGAGQGGPRRACASCADVYCDGGDRCAARKELEQEKHLLRRRLDTTQGEYEARLLELQNDIKVLTSKIDSKDNSVKQREEEKASLIAELTAQNSRLTTQLRQSSEIEAQLLAQLEGLKDQCSMRKTSLQDHVHSLESLKAELALVSHKKADLERRLTGSLNDKDNLLQQLDEANDRIQALERQLKEQEIQYQNTLKDLERLQRSHDTLAERIGAPDSGDSTDAASRSLHAEMESGPDDHDDGWLRAEAVQVYKQLRALALQLNTGHDDDSGLHSDLSLTSLDGEESETLRRGALAAACADAVAAYATLEGSRVRDSIAAHARRALDRERQIDEKNEIIADLSSKLSVAEVELQAAAEERDRLLNDINGSSLQNDEAVARARLERDEAMERKKAAEVALAKTRVELMQANSQLYEAVRQKIDLGQQLEQWQMDMQELIDEQMKHKLTSQEKRRKLPEPPQPPTRTSRLLGLFQR